MLGHRVVTAQHLPPERMVGEEQGRALLGGLVRRLVGVHQDLVEDHLPLGLEVGGPEGRAAT